MRVDFRTVALALLACMNTNCGNGSNGGTGGDSDAGAGGDTSTGGSNASGGAGTSGASGSGGAGASGKGNGSGGAGSGGAAGGGNTGGASGKGNSGGAGGKGNVNTGGASAGGSGNTGGASGSGNSNSGGAAGTGTIGGGDPNGDWANVTANLAGMSTMCGNTGLVAAKPDKDEVIAAVALHGLWSTVDAGKTWKQVGASQKLTASASVLIFDPNNSGHYWVAGNHASPGLVATSDDGVSFSAPDGAYGGLDYVSIDFSDPNRKVLLVGTHEVAQSVFLSTDSGANWKPIGGKLPGGVYCSTPFIVDAKTFVVGCADGQIQRSTDAGGTWSKVSSKGSNRAPLLASDNSLYWPCTDGSLIRTTDGGAHWADVLGSGSLGTPYPPIELPDGRVAAIANDGIVAGKADGGTWAHVAPRLPSDPWTMTYSGQEKAFYYGHGDCMDVVPSDAIRRFPYDYTKN